MAEKIYERNNINFKLVLKIRYSLDGILPTVPFKVSQKEL